MTTLDLTPGAVNPVNTSNQGSVPGASVMEDFDIDSLIPEDLRKAVEDNEKNEDNTPGVPQTEHPKHEVKSDNVPAPSDEDDEDLDFSPEKVEKMLEGDLDAVKKVTKQDSEDEDPEDVPFWEEDTEYKEFVTKASNYGIKKDVINGLIRKAVDKSIVDKSSFANALKVEVEQYKAREQDTKGEVERLRTIERGVNFDRLPETKQQFFDPMNESATEIARILEREAEGVSYRKVVLAKNTTELASIFADKKIPEAEFNKILTHWRNWKSLDTAYNAARSEALTNTAKATGVMVAPETVNNLLRGTLGAFMKDPRYKYLAEFAADTRPGSTADPKHAHATRVIAEAQLNFKNFISALSAAPEKISDSKFLKDLADYTFKSAHNGLIEQQHVELSTKYNKLFDTFKKVVKEHRKLASSAQGITGKRSGTGVSKQSKAETESNKGLLEEFQSLLKDGPSKLDEILGFGE